MKTDICIANKKYLDCTPSITITSLVGKVRMNETMDFELAELIADGKVLVVHWLEEQRDEEDPSEVLCTIRGTKYFNMKDVLCFDVRTLPVSKLV